ncbi:hypothetical protein HDU80_000409 [Chytriomyces hyalinus]|nr:hypothetical protein HDU80_000409 [Chytriomyces hyalinus]
MPTTQQPAPRLPRSTEVEQQAPASTKNVSFAFSPQWLATAKHVLQLLPCETWLRVIAAIDTVDACLVLSSASRVFRIESLDPSSATNDKNILRDGLIQQMMHLEPLLSLRLSAMVSTTQPGPHGQIDVQSGSDPLLLHRHIDVFLRRALGQEPDRYTDVFTEWVHYNANLSELELFELRDVWERKAGGARGRSVARDHAEWEGAYVRMAKEIKRDLCKVWAVLGKLFPFTKLENAVWREARLLREIPEGEDVGVGASNEVYRQSRSSKSKSKERNHSHDNRKPNCSNHASEPSARFEEFLPGVIKRMPVTGIEVFEFETVAVSSASKGGKRGSKTKLESNQVTHKRSTSRRHRSRSRGQEFEEEGAAELRTRRTREKPPPSPNMKFSTSAPADTRRQLSVLPVSINSPRSETKTSQFQHLSSSSSSSSSTATLLDTQSPYLSPSSSLSSSIFHSPQPRSILRKPSTGNTPLFNGTISILSSGHTLNKTRSHTMTDIAITAPPFDLDGCTLGAADVEKASRDEVVATSHVRAETQRNISPSLDASPLFVIDDLCGAEATMVAHGKGLRSIPGVERGVPDFVGGRHSEVKEQGGEKYVADSGRIRVSSAGHTPIISRKQMRLLKKYGASTHFGKSTSDSSAVKEARVDDDACGPKDVSTDNVVGSISGSLERVKL